MAEADLNKSINYLQLSMRVYVCMQKLLNNVISEASASITFNYFSLCCVGSRCSDNHAVPGASAPQRGCSAGGAGEGQGGELPPRTTASLTSCSCQGLSHLQEPS